MWCADTISHMPPAPAILPVLYSEPPALDLINTRLFLADDWVDLLDNRDQRTEWLTAEVGRLDVSAKDAGQFTTEAAEALKALRGDVADAVESARHGRKPSRRALTGLNDAARAAPASRQATWDGTALTASTRRDGTTAVRLSAGFAEAAMDLLAGPDISKVRRCEAPACTVLFCASNPRRRWCTPDICGNRARVARYYLRHKSE